MKKRTIIFWVIIIVGIALRIYNFPTLLQEMNGDEIMTVVNAKAIAETGKDIGGISFPVYLHGWGGQSVVLLYLMALSIKIFGYTLFAIRLPILLVSIISLFVFYDLVKKVTKNQDIALIGLTLVAFCPWQILQSVWALDCNMFPHFLLFAIDIFYTGITKYKKSILYMSMVFFAISLYCYGIAIYFVPIFLLVMAIYLIKNKEVTIKNIIICIAIFLILASPLVTMFAKNVLKIEGNIQIGPITIPYYESLSRKQDMVFFSPELLQQLWKNINSTLKVIIAQTDGAEWNSPKLFGATYRVTIIFAVVGIIKTIKDLKQDKRNTSSVMLITWLSTSILTGFIVNEANINRLNSIWYCLLILAGIGIYKGYQKIKYKKVYAKCVGVLYTAIFIAYTIYFYGYYTQVVDQSGTFSRGFFQSLNYVETLEQKTVLYDNIKNDGCLELYIQFNNDENKEYKEIRDENELKEKIKNIGEDEVLILDIEKKQYENVENSHQIGDFLVITK